MTDAPTTPDPIEIAMAAEAHDRSPDSPAQTLLKNQNRLVLWQIAGERAGFALKVLTALAGLAVAAGVALVAWQASRANGLVVEAFLVPPALAAQGATGEVVARDVLDRLGQIDAQARSLDTVRVSDAWTQSSKIQVAQTGLSIDDIQRLLRRWLGHETYVSGEVVQTPAGVRLKVRSGAGRTVAVEGTVDQLPALAERAAEQLFAEARPMIYAEVLLRRGDLEGVKPILARTLATSPDPRQRTIAWYLSGRMALIERRNQQALIYFREAARTDDPLRAAMAHGMEAVTQGSLGHPLQAKAAIAEAVRLIAKSNSPTKAQRLANYRSGLLRRQYDYDGAERVLRPVLGRIVVGHPDNNGFRPNYANLLALLHRVSEANRVFPDGNAGVAAAQEDWAAGIRLGTSGEESWADPAPESQALRLLVLARLGRLDEAREVAATLPKDCAPCVFNRAVLASVSGDRAAAEALFAAGLRLDPASASGLIAWGRERLAWGRPDAAVQSFQAAAKVAPRYADPLFWWGETLLIKGDAKGAAAKFAQAEPLAPKWGRLHLKWGQALAKLGKAEEAKAHWRTTAGLDLTAGERAELARVMP